MALACSSVFHEIDSPTIVCRYEGLAIFQTLNNSTSLFPRRSHERQFADDCSALAIRAILAVISTTLALGCKAE